LGISLYASSYNSHGSADDSMIASYSGFLLNFSQSPSEIPSLLLVFPTLLADLREISKNPVPPEYLALFLQIVSRLRVKVCFPVCDKKGDLLL